MNEQTGRRSDSEAAAQQSPQQIDPWMQQAPKSELSPGEALEATEGMKADPIEAQQPPLGYQVPRAAERGAERATDAGAEPVQVEQEWQPPELSNKKIDKTADLPHARDFDH